MTATVSAPADLLSRERRTLAAHLPELADYLRERTLEQLETPDGSALTRFKDLGGAGLTVPTELGGLGASAEEMAHIHRLIGARAPSLAVSTMMHHLSIATVVEATVEGSEEERGMVTFLVSTGALIASGFSEGTPGGGSVFAPTAVARRTADGYLISGRKRPCSMARSADLVMVSVATEDRGRGVATIAIDAPGVRVEPFWKAGVLRAAESEELILEDVAAPEMLLVTNVEADPTGANERFGYVWFGILTVASYLGMATALLERALGSDRRDEATFASAVSAVESAWSALVLVAREFDAGVRDDALSARIMHLRYGLQDTLPRLAGQVVETLGGMAFCASPDVSYLAGCLHAFALHPPSRRSIAPRLYEYHRTGSFHLPTPQAPAPR